MFKFNLLCLLIIIVSWTTTLSKTSQYDSVNSGSSATTTKLPDPLIRIDGEVHPEKAEENKLLGGLNPSTYDSSGGIQASKPPQPSPSNRDSKSSNKNSINTKPQSKKDESPVNKTSSTNSNPRGSASRSTSNAVYNPETPQENKANLGRNAAATSDAEQSTSTESLVSSEATTDLLENTGAPPASETSIEAVTEESQSSTKSIMSTSSIASASYEETVATSTHSLASKNQLVETTTTSGQNSASIATSSVEASPTENNLGSSETADPNFEVTTAQSSYENDEGDSPSSPVPPTDQSQREETTSPPAIEPSSPGTTPEQNYEETTPSSSTEEVTPNTSEVLTNEITSAYSSQASRNPSEEGQQPTTAEYEPSATTQQQTSQTDSSEDSSAFTDFTMNTNTPTSNVTQENVTDSSYDSSGSFGSVSPPPSNPSSEKKDGKKILEQPTQTPQPTQTTKPTLKSRAWKISQGNAYPVDGSTDTSDNTGSTGTSNNTGSTKTSNNTGSTGTSNNTGPNPSSANVNSSKNAHNIQASGYGENEVKVQTGKPAHVVSAQEAFGYEGIDPLPSLMAQRDPVIEKVDVVVSANKTTKNVNPKPKRKWQKYVFNCETETDDRGEHLCQEWARGGLCEMHKPTMFLFCRKTCLCIGPPEEDSVVTSTKKSRRKHLQNARL